MTTSVTKTALAATGGVVAAAVSTLCCAGPLVAVALGLSGAGLAATFDPLDPTSSQVPSWRSASASSCYEVRRSGHASLAPCVPRRSPAAG